MMDFNKWNLYWRLSESSTLDRHNFFVLGLPPPQTVNFQTYSQLVQQSQGGQARQGYEYVSLLWDSLTRYQAFLIASKVNAVLAADTPLYATIDFSDGSYLSPHFIDVSGTPIPVVLTPASNSQQSMYQNVELKINNLTVVNNPATNL